MSQMHEIELRRYREEMLDDVRALIDKYRAAMEWDIPETDEREAEKAIFKAVREALERVEHELRA